ncbi:ferritin-like domain-containing protein [uncultured Sphingomonas sp.]|uniref:ferritin-like domain-containing protein n=1 Tax=uncultured Sphingomonas sp. TaxID=158754 RepID=UPI0035CBAD17
MLDQGTVADILALTQKRRDERRGFIKMAAGSVAAAGGLSMLAACGNDTTPNPASPTPTPTVVAVSTDVDVLNFALNLEYLEASFYSLAAYGQPLAAVNQTGTGAQGTVTGGRQVSFTDPAVGNYAREIAADEISHVIFLRAQLGASAVALPALNIDGGATGAFTAAARAAGLVSATGTFDPYASDENFLLASFIFEDVGVTAYKGAAALITNKTYLEAAAGILAVEAYHAAIIRTTLYGKGINTTPSLITSANAISDARDSLDGSSDDDQGITMTVNGVTQANIVPTDANSLAYSRTTSQVLNIVYLNKAAVTSGGFFPAGVNGNIKASAVQA